MELYVFVSFPKPRRQHVTLFGSFLKGYFTIPFKLGMIITLDNTQCGKEDGWPWPTFQGHRGQTLTFFRVFAYFDLKYCMDSIQILHDCSFGSNTVRGQIQKYLYFLANFKFRNYGIIHIYISLISVERLVFKNIFFFMNFVFWGYFWQ